MISNSLKRRLKNKEIKNSTLVYIFSLFIGRFAVFLACCVFNFNLIFGQKSRRTQRNAEAIHVHYTFL